MFLRILQDLLNSFTFGAVESFVHSFIHSFIQQNSF